MKLKNSLVLGIAVMASHGAQAEVQPQAVDMGAFKFVPTLTVSHAYDDNIFNQASDTKGSSITRLQPQLQLIAESGANTYAATYRADIGRYNSSSDDDYADHGVSLDGIFDLGTRNNLTLAASFDQLHDARGTGSSEGGAALTRGEPDEYDLKGASAIWDFGAEGARFGARLTAGVSDIDYSNNKLETQFRNRDEQNLALRLYGRLQPKSRFFVEIEQDQIEYDHLPLPVVDPVSGNIVPGSTLDSDQRTISLGVEWDISGKTTGTVKVGRTNKDFDASGREDADLNSWEAEVIWSPRSYSTVSLSSSRQALETNGTGSYIDNKTTSLNWAHDWSSMLHSSVSVSVGTDEYDKDPRSDDVKGYSLGLNYDIDRWVNVGLSYSYDDRDSSSNAFSYTKKIVALTLDVSL